MPRTVAATRSTCSSSIRKLPIKRKAESRSDSGTWYTIDDRRGMAPHEFGHLIGLADEYNRTEEHYVDVTGEEPASATPSGTAASAKTAADNIKAEVPLTDTPAAPVAAADDKRWGANLAAVVHKELGSVQGGFSRLVAQQYTKKNGSDAYLDIQAAFVAKGVTGFQENQSAGCHPVPLLEQRPDGHDGPPSRTRGRAARPRTTTRSSRATCSRSSTSSRASGDCRPAPPTCGSPNADDHPVLALGLGSVRHSRWTTRTSRAPRSASGPVVGRFQRELTAAEADAIARGVTAAQSATSPTTDGPTRRPTATEHLLAGDSIDLVYPVTDDPPDGCGRTRHRPAHARRRPVRLTTGRDRARRGRPAVPGDACGTRAANRSPCG